MSKFPCDAMFSLVSFYRNLPLARKKVMERIGPEAVKKYVPLHNYNLDIAVKIKESVDMPVIVVGGIREYVDITGIIETKGVDFVSMSRPFIIEPDIVNKFKNKQQEKSRCMDCGYCLFGVMEDKLKCYYGRIKYKMQSEY